MVVAVPLPRIRQHHHPDSLLNSKCFILDIFSYTSCLIFLKIESECLKLDQILR